MKMTKLDQAIEDVFGPQRDVEFFLRLHRHLPDVFCGKSPIGRCEYREDGKAINQFNKPVEEMKQDPLFRQKEKEVEMAVAKKWREHADIGIVRRALRFIHSILK